MERIMERKQAASSSASLQQLLAFISQGELISFFR
jgi:hypothetical protein